MHFVPDWLVRRFSFNWKSLLGLAVIGFVVAAVGFGPQWWRNRQALSFERQCRELRNRRDWTQLASVSETWTQRDPQRANAWLFRAEAAEGQRQHVAAADFLFQVPSHDAKSVPAFLQGATILLGKANRPIEGVEALHKLLKREQRIAEVHRNLIQYYALTLQRQRLLEQIRFAIENHREPVEAFVYLFLVDTLRLSNGVEMNNRWLEQYPDHELFLVARTLHMEEQREVASDAAENKGDPAEHSVGSNSPRSQALAELLQRFPHNVELLSHQIELSLVLGDTDRVVSLLSQAPPEIDEDNRFWRYKGQVHEARGQDAEAESAYRRSFELNRLDWRSLNKLASIERLRGRFSEVDRLQRLVNRADNLREQIRKVPNVEDVGADWLRALADFAKDAGDETLASALFRRLGISS